MQGRTHRKPHPAVFPMQRLKRQPVYLAVHRKQFMVYSRRVEREAFRILQALERREPLGTALDRVARSSRLDHEELAAQFHEWFADWSQAGWFTSPVRAAHS